MNNDFKRGSNVCSNCKYYRESVLCPTMRCTVDSNLRLPTYGRGIIYMKSPDNKNWDYNCEDYEEKVK